MLLPPVYNAELQRSEHLVERVVKNVNRLITSSLELSAAFVNIEVSSAELLLLAASLSPNVRSFAKATIAALSGIICHDK